MGPIKFGMTPEDVQLIIGRPIKIRKSGNILRETRELNVPIIRYTDGGVSEIEAFYDVSNVSFEEIPIFKGAGRDVLSYLENRNGEAKIDVGIVLFGKLGITIGRIDEDVPGEHSVCAFRKGLWDDDKDFKPISFR
jgi:hypothetical protein